MNVSDKGYFQKRIFRIELDIYVFSIVLVVDHIWHTTITIPHIIVYALTEILSNIL
jgi:hypothetical protein